MRRYNVCEESCKEEACADPNEGWGSGPHALGKSQVL